MVFVFCCAQNVRVEESGMRCIRKVKDLRHHQPEYAVYWEVERLASPTTERALNFSVSCGNKTHR